MIFDARGVTNLPDVAPWSTPFPGGFTPGDRRFLFLLTWQGPRLPLRGV